MASENLVCGTRGSQFSRSQQEIKRQGVGFCKEFVICVLGSFNPSLGFPGGSAGKESPAMRENWVRSLGWEDPMEEGMATHSSILTWRIPTDRGAWWAAVHGAAKSWTQLNN